MTSLATNIGYYHAHNFISNIELEFLLMHVVSLGDEKRIVPLHKTANRALPYHHRPSPEAVRTESPPTAAEEVRETAREEPAAESFKSPGEVA